MNFQQTYLYWLAGAVLLVVALAFLLLQKDPTQA